MAGLTWLRIPPSPVEDSALARLFVWLGFAVAAASMAIYGQDYLVPAAAVALGAAGHAASYRRRRQPRGTARQAVVAGLVFAALAYFLLDSVGGIFGGTLPQAHFAEMLVAVTSFDLKTRRNLYSSLWITLAVLYLAAVYAWDYPFGLFVSLWAVCLAGFWAASHLRRMEARPSFASRPVIAAGVGALVAGAALFALVPQPTAHPDSPLVVSLPSGTTFKGEMESPALPLVQFGSDRSGANGNVDLRYRGRLGDAVVMYVRTGAPAYWRGLVFDRYSGGLWTASRSDFRIFPPYVDQHLLPPPPGPQLGTFVEVVRVTRPMPGIIYAAAPVQAIYYPAAQLREDAYGSWRAPGLLEPNQTYSVVSSLPDYTPASLEASEGPDDMSSADRDFTGLSARAQGLAHQAVGDAADRYQIVMALTRYLQTNYQYSLELGHVPAGKDPVDWFLFDARIGYCEQFATAETLMLRSLGIPARLATGYSTGTYDPVLNQAVVHEHDAHAWVEAFFPGHGWVPVDPSPGFPTLAATRFPDRFATSGLAHLIPHLTLGAPGAALTGLGLAGILPGLAAVLVAIAALAAWALRRRRPRGPRPPPEQVELLRLYARLQRRIGRRRAGPETPREYQVRAPATLSAVTAEVTRAVELGAYRGTWPNGDELRRLRDKLGRP